MDRRNRSMGVNKYWCYQTDFLNYIHSVHEDEKWDCITKSYLIVYKMEILELKLK